MVRVLVLFLACMALPAHAAWIQYETAGGPCTTLAPCRLAGLNPAAGAPVPTPPEGIAVVEVTTTFLNNLSNQQPVGHDAVQCDVPLEEAQDLLRVTSETPFVVEWVSPLACMLGILASSVAQVDQLETELLNTEFARVRNNRGPFHASLAAWTYQRCTAPIDGVPSTSPNCDRLRNHLQNRGPTISNVLEILDATDAARAVFP